jgi:glycosyltransferase XagB
VTAVERRLVPIPKRFSAKVTFTNAQAWWLVSVLAVILVSALLAPRWTAACVLAIGALLFAAITADRLWLLVNGLRKSVIINVDDELAFVLDDDELPPYTVLLPAYDEPEIVQSLLHGIGRLDYPRDKLQVLLVLEADDDATLNALSDGAGDFDVTVVRVPPSHPRTKPKACNYALENVPITGEFITIYDAEDRPDPLQLRRVVYAFQRQDDPTLVCIQCRLGYFNERQNTLTRWFAIEYEHWFRYILPELGRRGCALPLGGTSNHIRAEVLMLLGGWDAFNVTEDADLGIRLARCGYRTAVLDSTTLEEANSDAINWVRQRSRWYKGYLQTFLVHFRDPRQLVREVGLPTAMRIATVTAGMPIANIANLLFWYGIWIWYAGKPSWMGAIFPPPVYYGCLAAFILGNAATLFVTIVLLRLDRKSYLVPAALISPFYWLLQSLGAFKGAYQLLARPSYWEKTVHGLGGNEGAPVTPLPTQDRA